MSLDPSIPLQGRQASFSLGDMLGGMQQIRQSRIHGQQEKIQGLQLRHAEQEQADDDAINEVLKTAAGPDGRPNYGAAASQLEAMGRGQAAQKIRTFEQQQAKAAAEASKLALEAKSKEFELLDQRFGQAYNLLAYTVKNPAAYANVRGQIGKLLPPELAGQLPEAFDEAVVKRAMTLGENTSSALKVRKQVTDEIAARGTAQKDERENVQFWTKQMGSWLSTADTPDEWTTTFGMARDMNVPDGVMAQFSPTWTPKAQAEAGQVTIAPEKRAELAGQAAGRAEVGRHNRTMEGVAKDRLAAEQTGTPNLTPAALDVVANQFAMTGQLPPMGMGSKAAKARTDIINRAAELYEGLDLPSQAAAYKANRDSLGKLQQQRDAVHSFESTARKNIDVFLDTAGKVVDTGSPMANSLARHVTGKMLGSEDQAKYDAARAVVLPEIAKIINNPNLTGVLSDSARHEIAEFNPTNATLKQTVSVMRLLQRDMDNRMTSIDDEIGAVKSRIAKPPKPGAAATEPTGASGTVRMRAPNGQEMDVAPGDVAHYAALGATKVR